MTSKDIKAQIEQTARSFDAEVHTEAYARTHFDADQLRRLLAFLAPRDGQSLLDLGTGGGYVAMALAGAHPACHVTGLDIATEAIRQDIETARRQGLSNIDFRVFGGVTLPFADDRFDGAVCRYAFHHFPRAETTLRELARTLRRGGRLVLADPVRAEVDGDDFINRFQDLKGDGHVRIHRLREFLELVGRHGFELVDSFGSAISFGRARDERYDALLASTPAPVRAAYDVSLGDDEIRLTFNILNTVFLNRKQRP